MIFGEMTVISSSGSVLCFLCSCACDALVRWQKSSQFEGVLLCTDRGMFQRNVLVELMSHELSYVILRVKWKGKTLGLSLITIPAPLSLTGKPAPVNDVV